MNRYQISYMFDIQNIRKKQEEWRTKQFNIFYGSGRPIYNINKDTEHLRSHNNPYYYKDPCKEELLSNCKITKRNNLEN